MQADTPDAPHGKPWTYTDGQLFHMSPSSLRRQRDRGQISEKDIDRWADLAAGACMRTTNGDEL